MRYLNFYKRVIPVLLILFFTASCKKLLDVEAKDILEEKKMYKDVFDADAAIVGLYGKFMNLADRYVILNELRADLLTTTVNADENLKQLNEHNVQAGNPYASPRPFYEIILNCNDIMHNFDIMLRDKKIKQLEYNMRYSDVAALRCWVYLQLGVQFGRVPYITDQLSSSADVVNLSSMERLPFKQLLDSLTRTMESLPYLEPYAASASLSTIVDGYSTNKFFINKRVMLGELYLWRGNSDDYNKAASTFKYVMETGTGQLFNYRMSGSSKGDNNDIAVGYIRYREEDEVQLVDNNSQGWRSIFARSQDALFNYEWVWYLPFDKNFQPTNPFIKIFSNRGGSYLVKPSQAAMDNWNSQLQKNDFPYDARGRIFTYKNLDGQPVVMKYLYNYLDATSFNPVSLLDKSGKWFLYRAASLHLGFAEAANRDNHRYLANVLLNQGLTTIPNRITTEGNPYNFDSRKSDNPKITGDWSQNAGVRGRAYLYSVPVTGDSTISIENNIINEGALELAYEGRRWYDLVRVALRRNDPAFLADKIYNKLKKENNPNADNVRTKLMTIDNWYLPFN